MNYLVSTPAGFYPACPTHAAAVAQCPAPVLTMTTTRPCDVCGRVNWDTSPPDAPREAFEALCESVGYVEGALLPALFQLDSAGMEVGA